MIDPGHPFSVTLPELVTGLEDRIRDGVEQPASTRFLVSETTTSFELPSGTYAVTRVAGLSHAEYTVFAAGQHYEVRGNRLVWAGTERPDSGSWLDVDYTYRDRPAGLTDFNAGSVVSTLLRAVAYEMKTLYAQMDEAYRRAFIDQATGVALDNVVALLGVPRKPAQAAKGTVTFFRKRATDLRIPIPPQTRVADRAGRVFVTSEAAGIEASLEEFRLPQAGAVTVTNWIAEVVGVWPRSADPDTEPSLENTLDTDPRLLHVDPSVTAELRIRYRPRSVTVPIDAQAPGPDGNAAPDTIVVMPTPPTGIDGITNESALTGGEEAEPDDQLRERAKHALERAGNATLDAIRFALLGIEGVSGVTVTDHAADETIPLGEVWVRWAGDDDAAVSAQVDQVVNSTRAAGVVARIQRINEVRLSGTLYAIPEPGAQLTAAGVLLERVVATLNELPIAEPLSLRRLTALAYDVPGLAEVAESVLTYTKPVPAQDPPEETGPVTDPFIVGPTEVVRAASGELAVVLLAGPSVSAADGGGDTHTLTITLLDRTGQIAPLTTFALDLSVTVKARSKETPDRPAAPVGRTVKRATFGGDHTATVGLSPADYPSYNSDEHLPDLTVVVSAAVYPGLTEAAVTIILPDGE
ncbi:baseplate J/gp47 family protein [Flindersiella endophytica]